MNTYSKYTTHVFLAKCLEKHEKGEIIEISTRHGKENECIVHNLVYEKGGFYYYSIIRADGFTSQEWAKKRAERHLNASINASKKSAEYWKASHEGRDFLSLGEPIKIGHHSERRHRNLIERNHNRMAKSVELTNKAEEYSRKADYWDDRAKDINLSMPESLEYFEHLLSIAKAQHEGLKNGTIERRHNYDLQYAKKEVNELQKKVDIARKLWA
jgi:hypothetical protein